MKEKYMQQDYIHNRYSGFLWAAAFVLIAALTITTCIRQERVMAEKSSVVIAMGSN